MVSYSDNFFPKPDCWKAREMFNYFPTFFDGLINFSNN